MPFGVFISLQLQRLRVLGPPEKYKSEQITNYSILVIRSCLLFCYYY